MKDGHGARTSVTDASGAGQSADVTTARSPHARAAVVTAHGACASRLGPARGGRAGTRPVGPAPRRPLRTTRVRCQPVLRRLPVAHSLQDASAFVLVHTRLAQVQLLANQSGRRAVMLLVTGVAPVLFGAGRRRIGRSGGRVRHE